MIKELGERLLLYEGPNPNLNTIRSLLNLDRNIKDNHLHIDVNLMLHVSFINRLMYLRESRIEIETVVFLGLLPG
jgi:hypothetical protein